MLELARSEDREAVNALALQAHGMHVSWRPDLYERMEEPYSEERFRAAVKERSLYVARVCGAIAGYVAVQIRNYDWPGVVKRKVMLIEEICVDELCRGQGIGTEMMMELHALARAFGCRDLQLNVSAHNDEAVGFYQKCGFAIQNIGMQKQI